MPDPNPGPGAEGDFERAAPVNAAPRRIRGVPTGEKSCDAIQELAVLREAPGLGHGHQILVAIQFPDHFMVAGEGAVQIRDTPKVGRAGHFAGNNIAPPFGRDSPLLGFSEQDVAAAQGLFGDAFHMLGEGTAAQEIDHRRGIGQTGERRRRFRKITR